MMSNISIIKELSFQASCLAFLFLCSSANAGVWVFKQTTKNGKPADPTYIEEGGVYVAKTEREAWELLKKDYEFSGVSVFSLIQGCPGSGWFAHMNFMWRDNQLNPTIPFAGACGMKSRDAALAAAVASCRKKDLCKREMESQNHFFSVFSYKYSDDESTENLYCEWNPRTYSYDPNNSFCTTDTIIPGTGKKINLPSFHISDFFNKYDKGKK